MIALLAILSHVCPKSVVDDAIATVIREKHSNNLSKIELGEEGYEDLFVFACPKFVNPAVPDYAGALSPGCPAVPYGHDAYKLQVQQFMGEMATHVTLRKMRSYMSLYTSIEVEKLASFNDKKVQEFGPWLTCSNAESALPGVIRGGVGSDMDRIGLALGIHYHVSGNVVHVDEAEKTRRFETFFMKQIENNDDILRQLGNIKIEM
jgi:translation initiation factor 3 subunit L